jgi:hypothetical protein
VTSWIVKNNDAISRERRIIEEREWREGGRREEDDKVLRFQRLNSCNLTYTYNELYTVEWHEITVFKK